ncbi:hypothetical protein ABZU45_42440 [Streptomyces avermitilis]|uniref:hypothetical protein n=1 Tax=Streptomyces avermitilis TaxID=33903 RepID=UPI0033AA7D31
MTVSNFPFAEMAMSTPARDRLLYFSPVDGGIEYSVKRKDFRESLVYNILLEPNGILITDVFFFNCQFLIELAEGERHSLFTRALEESLVVPAFRSEGTYDFTTSLRRDIGESNVQGVEASQYSTSPLNFARWLDQCYRKSTERKRLVWPLDMGSAFGDFMVRVFTRSDLCSDDERLQSIWQETRQLRESSLEDGRLSTRLAGGTGIRRGEIINSLGRRLGLLQDGEIFNKPGDLLSEVASHRREFDSYRAEQIRLLVDTVNLCYQRSQTAQFNLDPRYSVCQNIPGALLVNAGTVIQDLQAPAPTGVREPADFTTTVRLPSVETLLRADSSNLIAIRKSDRAEEYFAKRLLWTRNPTERAEIDLKESLQRYAAELVRFAVGPQEDRVVTFVQRTINETVNLSVGSLVGYGLNKAGVSPEVSLVSGIAAGATAVVGKLVGDRPRVPKSSFTVKIAASPEVILPFGD